MQRLEALSATDGVPALEAALQDADAAGRRSSAARRFRARGAVRGRAPTCVHGSPPRARSKPNASPPKPTPPASATNALAADRAAADAAAADAARKEAERRSVRLARAGRRGRGRRRRRRSAIGETTPRARAARVEGHDRGRRRRRAIWRRVRRRRNAADVRDVEAKEIDRRARREALNRLQQLLPASNRSRAATICPVKAAERALCATCARRSAPCRRSRPSRTTTTSCAA